MNKVIGVLFLIAGLVALAEPLHAQEQQVPDDSFTLMKRAVEYATKADAYNAYCSDPSSMASDYLDHFYTEEGVTTRQKEELAGVMEKEAQDFLAWLKKDEPVCTDLEFMMRHLEVMRKLRDVSYRLNGVDPATLPQDDIDIPNLDDLLPQRSGGESFSVPQ